MIEAEPDLAAAAVRTAELMAMTQKVPLFEATFAHEGVLVRLDVMEPGEDGAWHVAEVKSATWPINLLPNSGRKLAAKWAEEVVFELNDIPEGQLTNRKRCAGSTLRV